MMNAKIITLLAVLCAASINVLTLGDIPAAEKKHRVVFQVISDGNEQWDAVLGNVENLRTALGPAETEIAVIAHGKGLGLMIAAGNKHAERMKKLSDAGVAFIACENTMKKKSVKREQLHAFVTTVDSGVAEIVRRQEAGWSYIKSGI